MTKPPGQPPLLEVDGLVKHFPVRGGVFSRVLGAVRAVDGVTFSIPRGKTLSLVGESGSGKTTAGRSILRLIEPSAGRVLFNGVDLTRLDRREMRRYRKAMQIIFQDPYGSLNPRMTVYNMLSEILSTHKIVPRAQRRQRIGIARALAVEPELIVADEPISALDVSIQAQILNLLRDVQERLGLTYLFIAHDLSVVRHISDYVAVMYLGRIVERGRVDDIFERPVHPYTKALLAAAPVPNPKLARARQPLAGDVPSPIHPPPGCHFHPRCPDAVALCRITEQRLVEIAPGHWAACSVHAPQPE